jgi:hypothetical protein
VLFSQTILTGSAWEFMPKWSFEQNEGLPGVCQPFVVSFALRSKKNALSHFRLLGRTGPASREPLLRGKKLPLPSQASAGAELIFLQSVDKFIMFMTYDGVTLSSSHRARELHP